MQALRQRPLCFEFTEDLLLLLADQLYACRFGTFLSDCELERERLGLPARTRSVWSLVNGNGNANDANANHAQGEGKGEGGHSLSQRCRNTSYCAHPGPVPVSCNPKNIVLWESFFQVNFIVSVRTVFLFCFRP